MGLQGGFGERRQRRVLAVGGRVQWPCWRLPSGWGAVGGQKGVIPGGHPPASGGLGGGGGRMEGGMSGGGRGGNGADVDGK